MNERISREELVKIYNVELHFFDELAASGLINPQTENQIAYLRYEELPAFEKFANWHFDLEVNLPGLEVISGLLSKIKELQHENRRLAHLRFLSEQGLWTEAELTEQP